MRNIKYLFIGFAMMGALAGCSKEVNVTPADETKGDASVVLNIATKFDAPGTTSAADGGAMVDVLVVSVSTKNNQMKIDGKKHVTLGGERATTSIQIDGLTYGPHELYLFANTAGFDSVYPGLIQSVNDMQVDDDFSAIAEAKFPALASKSIPAISNGVMPLTGSIKGIELGVGVTELVAELIRPFVHLTVNVYNEAMKTLQVSGVHFNDFNPSTAYVFDHFKYSSANYTPAGLAYQSMPDCPNITVPSRTAVAIFDGLLYEGRFNNHTHNNYEVSLDFLIPQEHTTYKMLTMSDFNALSEGQVMNVYLANPRSAANRGRFVGNTETRDGQNFAVQGTTVTFTDTTKMREALVDIKDNAAYKAQITKVSKANGTCNITLGGKVMSCTSTSKYNTIRTSGTKDIFKVDTLSSLPAGIAANVKAANCFTFNYNNISTSSYLVTSNTNSATLGCSTTVSNNVNVWTLWQIIGDLSRSANNLVFKQVNENREASPMLRMLRNNKIVINIYVGYYDNPVEDFAYNVAPWTESTNNIIYK